MKHHGNYYVMSPEELLVNIETGSSSEFIDKMVKKIRQKYHNDKRHKEKRYKKYGRS